ncbi:DUF4928 family protein [Nonomuraea salmonea]|uniref:DUF4928 family protein n=1 Tax=Nonomuraea salmonea TaxID=46181 RepID=UPI003CD0BFCA
MLAQHGETRKFTREGGRTSRFTIRHADKLAEIINASGMAEGLASFSGSERKSARFRPSKKWFVDRVRDDYFEKQKN